MIKMLNDKQSDPVPMDAFQQTSATNQIAMLLGSVGGEIPS